MAECCAMSFRSSRSISRPLHFSSDQQVDAPISLRTATTMPAHHHGLEHDAPELGQKDQELGNSHEYVRYVEGSCRERGLRMTPLRSDVLRILATSPRPLKAYDLLDRIRASKARSAPAMAYRALNFLLQHGFIHRLETLSAFVVCHYPGDRNHVAPFLICDVCHQATELKDEQTESSLRQQAEAAGFRLLSQTLEVKGVCAACSRSRFLALGAVSVVTNPVAASQRRKLSPPPSAK